MNSNLFHNIANVIMALLALITALMLAFGCTPLPNDDLECSQSMISPALAAWLMWAIALLKLLVNVFRDGVAGLVKRQPPVE